MLEGTVIGNRYAITRMLGEGGMGCVYEARHLGTGRKVALKVISAELVRNASIVARLEAEAQAAGSIDSEHITQVVDVGRDEATETPYLVMELLDGEDLGDLLVRLGPLEPTLVARIGAQIATGLEAAHAKSIVHRDLKPANLFLSRRDGGEVKVKILDFGISKSLEVDETRPQSNKLTKTGTIMGSPIYMSPEQTRAKNVDHRSDLWSFGVVLYELLTSTTPFDGSGAIADLIIDICTGPITPVKERAPWTPPALAAVVDRALVRDPAQRWQSAREMRAAIEACLPEVRPIRSGDLVGANRTPIATPAPRAGDVTSIATPVGAAPSASGGRAAPAATVAYSPASAGTTSAALIAAPTAASPAKKGSPLPIVIGLVAAAGLGVGGFIVLRGKGSTPTTDTSSAAASTGTAPPPSAPTIPSTSLAAATPSVTASVSAAPPPDPALVALEGKWVSGTGKHYDGVLVGDALELRVRDPKEMPTLGYEKGDARLTLRSDPAKKGVFTVVDHVRIDPPVGSYGGAAPASCRRDLEIGGGAPLTAKSEGDKLTVAMGTLFVVETHVTRNGQTVSGCVGLDKIQPGRTETVYTREK